MKVINDNYISLELAKKAKECGFNVPVHSCYEYDEFTAHETGEHAYELKHFMSMKPVEYCEGGREWLEHIINQRDTTDFDTYNAIDYSFIDYNQDIRKVIASYNGWWTTEDTSENAATYLKTFWGYELYNTLLWDETYVDYFDSIDFQDGDWSPILYLDTYSAPTYGVLEQWLREVHNLYIVVEPYDLGTDGHEIAYDYTIKKTVRWDNPSKDTQDEYPNCVDVSTVYFTPSRDIIHTYNEAKEAALKKAMEFINKSNIYE